MSYHPRPFKVFTSAVSYLNDTPDDPTPTVIWKSIRGEPEREDLIQVLSGVITLVSSRKVRENARYAIQMALDLSRTHRVLHVNSYAGPGLLKEMLKSELAKPVEVLTAEFALDSAFPDCDASEIQAETASVSTDSVSTESVTTESVTTQSLSTQSADINSFETPAPEPGLHMLNSEIGMWESNYHEIRREIRTNATEVLILNSFEFAPLSHREKGKLAFQLIELNREFGVTVVVFTQEVKKGMEVGSHCRGPLGILTANAASIFSLEPNPPKRFETEGIHCHFSS